MNETGWDVVKMDGGDNGTFDVHIMPCGDVEPGHVTDGPNCPCKPRCETYDNGNRCIVHNSFDGREGLEAAEKVLGCNPAVN